MVTAVHPVLGRRSALHGTGARRAGPRLATGVLDLLRDAVLVLGRDARPLGMNRAAHTLLREGDGLALSSRGVVASTPGATMALRRGIERAAQGEAGRVQVPRIGPHAAHAAGRAASAGRSDGRRGGRLRDGLRVARAARRGRWWSATASRPPSRSVARRLAAGVDLERIAGELEHLDEHGARPPEADLREDPHAPAGRAGLQAALGGLARAPIAAADRRRIAVSGEPVVRRGARPCAAA